MPRIVTRRLGTWTLARFGGNFADLAAPSGKVVKVAGNLGGTPSSGRGGVLPNRFFFFLVKASCIMRFCVADVAIRDTLMRLQTRRKSFCGKWASAILLCRCQKMSCIFRSRGSTSDTSIVILRDAQQFLRVLHESQCQGCVRWWQRAKIACQAGYVVTCDDTPHSTLHTLHSAHSTLYTPHFTLHTLHSTLHTLHSTLYTPHFTLYTPHFTLYTPSFTLRTLHSTL